MRYMNVMVLNKVPKTMWNKAGAVNQRRLVDNGGHTCTYIDPIGVETGDVVVVPYGHVDRIGVVADRYRDRPDKHIRYKPIHERLSDGV